MVPVAPVTPVEPVAPVAPAEPVAPVRPQRLVKLGTGGYGVVSPAPRTNPALIHIYIFICDVHVMLAFCMLDQMSDVGYPAPTHDQRGTGCLVGTGS